MAALCHTRKGVQRWMPFLLAGKERKSKWHLFLQKKFIICPDRKTPLLTCRGMIKCVVNDRDAVLQVNAEYTHIDTFYFHQINY